MYVLCEVLIEEKRRTVHQKTNEEEVTRHISERNSLYSVLYEMVVSLLIEAINDI